MAPCRAALAGSIASYVGSLVLTNQRVIGTLSSVPKLAGRTIDLRWDAPQSGPVKAELSATGLTLDVDVAAVDPRCSGELSLHYKVDIPADVLARLPRHLAGVRRAAGVRLPRGRRAVPPLAWPHGLMSDLGMSSDKSALVLMHGILMSGNAWADVIPLLSDHHQVYTHHDCRAPWRASRCRDARPRQRFG